MLAVTSGKGGVGKTNIAANLAICLAAANRRVLLLDADMSLGNLDLVMNIHGKYNISHVISGRKSMEEIIQTGPKGLRVVCGASGLDRLADITEGEQHRLLEHLGRLQHQTDTILIDTAAGYLPLGRRVSAWPPTAFWSSPRRKPRPWPIPMA